MPSVTLVHSARLAQDELVSGVIETVVTVNKMFEVLPFDAIDGNAIAYNRELAADGSGGDAGGFATDNLTAPAGVATDLAGDGTQYKNAAGFTQVTSRLTKIIGDAEVDNLIQATRSGDGNDQKGVQIAAKAKSVGREYQRMLINGTGTGNEFTGLISLLTAGQTSGLVATNGSNLSFEIMDEVIDLVIDKDGDVDYMTMPARTIRAFNSLLRGLGGASINDVVQLPSGAQVPAYRAIPLFRNDYIPVNQTRGSANTATTMFAGTLDDGSRKYGIAGLTAANAAGIQVVEVGEAENRDESITRVRWYCGLANFSTLGLAGAVGILN